MPLEGATMKITETRCSRCDRPLRSAASIAAGIGPICARAARVAATGFSADQLDAAREVIGLGGVAHTSGRGAARVYAVAGSRGDTYSTSAAGECSCPAGTHGRRCYHLAAVALYAGTVPAHAA
jgi:hypothetical protein